MGNRVGFLDGGSDHATAISIICLNTMNPADAVKALYNLLVTMVPSWRRFLWFVTLALAAFEFFNTLWTAIFVKLDALALFTFPTLGFAPLGTVNAFFPLTELFTYFTQWCVLYLACSGIKVLKSFVPFLAS